MYRGTSKRKRSVTRQVPKTRHVSISEQTRRHVAYFEVVDGGDHTFCLPFII